MSRYDAVVIGGGASGMLAALLLAKGGKKTLLLEAGARLGKKLLATGGGRCNLSNENICADAYNNDVFVKSTIENFGVQKIRDVFYDLGLLTKVEEGRVYPVSDSAATVLDVLRFGLEKYGAEVKPLHKVVEVKKDAEGGFVVFGSVYKENSEELPQNAAVKIVSEKKSVNRNIKSIDKDNFTVFAKDVIVACGSPAGDLNDAKSPAYEKLFKSIESLGHNFKQFNPALAPLVTDKSDIKGLSGLRVKASISFLEKEEKGEIQFRDFGVSGIAVFNLAKQAGFKWQSSESGKAPKILTVDFLPDVDLAAAEKIVEDIGIYGILRRPVAEAVIRQAAKLVLNGVSTEGESKQGKKSASKKAQPVMSSTSNMPQTSSSSKNSFSNTLPEGVRSKDLAYVLKNYQIRVEKLGDMQLAQTAAGGLSVDGFDPFTMQSKTSKGLYAVGEAVDVDGTCGGFNLHWAWASACAAVDSILK